MATLHFLKIAGMFFIPLIAVLVPVYLGWLYGKYRLKRNSDILLTHVGTIVAAAFALMGFMLAFTFNLAANRFDARKKLLLESVTNIRTVYLRAGIVPEPYQSNTRKQIIEFVDLGVSMSQDTTKIDLALTRSLEILDILWKYAETLATQDRHSEAYALYASSINSLIDSHNHRITTVLEYRIQNIIFLVLFIIAFLSMLGLGYQFGISGKGSVLLTVLFAMIIAVVMFLILALDRPEIRLVNITQTPIFNLQKELKGERMNMNTFNE